MSSSPTPSMMSQLSTDILGVIFLHCVALDIGAELADEEDSYSDSPDSEYSPSESSDSEYPNHSSESTPFPAAGTVSLVPDDDWPEDSSESDMSSSVSWSWTTDESFCSDDDDEPPYFPRNIMDRAPWILTQVCSFWRSTALSLPRLWSRINVDCEIELFGSRKPSIKLLKRRLELSGVVPLSVTFFCSSDTPESRQSLVALLYHSNQWQDVDLCMPLDMMPLLSIHPISLRQFRIASSSYMQPSAPLVFTDFTEASNLTSISLFIQHTFFSLPWDQLTDLCLTDSFSNLFDVLRQTPNVTACNFTVLSFKIPQRRPVILPKLRCMEISAFHNEAFLDDMTLAALEELTVLPAVMDPTNLAVAVHNLIRRSSAPITRLVVRAASSFGLDTIVPTQLFALIPDIEHLSIGIKDDLSFLTFNDEFLIPVLPKLQTLQLWMLEGSLAHLVDTLATRYTTNRRGDEEIRRLLEMEIALDGGQFRKSDALVKSVRKQMLPALRREGLSLKVWVTHAGSPAPLEFENEMTAWPRNLY
ncbi:hypothetical protein C8J56DRAFT_466187 [Mycena floridula]|nr:hypothetical protein C8J56DRAFT_466187 [Mycena floridula]